MFQNVSFTVQRHISSGTNTECWKMADGLDQETRHVLRLSWYVLGFLSNVFSSLGQRVFVVESLEVPERTEVSS